MRINLLLITNLTQRKKSKALYKIEIYYNQGAETTETDSEIKIILDILH